MGDVMNVVKALTLGSVLCLAGVGLVGCGPSAEEQAAASLKIVCDEANALLPGLPLDSLFPSGSSDFSEVAQSWSTVSQSLTSLSKDASSAGNDQLARDLASVGDDANYMRAVAETAGALGYGNVVMEWMDGINAFGDNSALFSQSNMTFVGCG